MTAQFSHAMQAIDDTNAQDPHWENGTPKELAYARKMSEWLAKLEPHASEALQLAARGQHIKRWSIPRSEYAMDKAGYKQWRLALTKIHADTTGDILKQHGYDAAMIGRVQSLIRKERMKSDPESQLLEDVVCLVFLENYFAEFSNKHDENKVLEILRKTWAKMSERGHQEALKIAMPPEALRLVQLALS